ncbi:MAG TPA: DUF6519 domain-containing protein [Trichocoleus sp.]
MQGELRGDFTRDTYSPQKQFLRVLMQQGRVQIDADFNEQVSILLNYLQTLATDLIGPYGAPAANAGFGITPKTSGSDLANLEISPGRYYIEGLLCENPGPTNADQPVTFENQPYFPQPNADKGAYDYPELPFLVYLDVWERHIDHTQDAAGGIREVALGGPDTATRSKIIWQVKHTESLNGDRGLSLEQILNPAPPPAPPEPPADGQPPADPPADGQPPNAEVFALAETAANRLKTEPDLLLRFLDLEGKTPPLLKARAAKSNNSSALDPCIVSPDARYRGAENQLYRVEIHTGGENPTFKWSRENSAVVFPIASAAGDIVTLEHLGYDSRFSLREGDWVEVIDDEYVHRGEPGPLRQVQKIDLITLQVTLSKLPTGVAGSATGTNSKLHPGLRRWDHRVGNPNLGGSSLTDDGVVLVKLAGPQDESWQTLENGVQVQFLPGNYHPGDYWLIPTRTATGDVEWPQEPQGSKLIPQALPPHGVKHYYAPLAMVTANAQNTEIVALDCRYQFSPMQPPVVPNGPADA